MRDGAHAHRRMPGEPLLVLAAVLGGWIALRVLLWQSPFADEAVRAGTLPGVAVAAPAPTVAVRLAPIADTGGAIATPSALAFPQVPSPAILARDEEAVTAAPPRFFWTLPAAGAVMPKVLVDVVATAAHPESLPDEVRTAPAARRWSTDAWLLVRGGSGGPLAAIGPSYGRSQAGAVLRYRLAPASAHRPVAYARLARALAGAPETELAAGMAGRPLAGLPASLAAELRYRDGDGGREVRPAAYAVTELPPVELPFGLRGEAYAQAGYVAGRFATAFIDGQARIDAPLARLAGHAEFRAGAGVWGGAQQGSARLDVGPSAALSFAIGAVQSRLALDYRFRVAGDAAPGSGPALTISAGF